MPSQLLSNQGKYMNNQIIAAQIIHGDGFIAALDQSGGSTPGALRLYGIPDTAYASETEMFAFMHEMRVRILTSPAFTGAQVLGAILFENTMDGQAKGMPVPAFLRERDVVPSSRSTMGWRRRRVGSA
jgi:fructose-bisphosphate aldolase class I